MNHLDLNGRHAVVTGGASGIGFAIAQRLAGSGATVAIWDLDEAAGRMAAAALSGSAVAVDVGDAASVASAVQATLQATPAIDILINNAGITGPNDKLWDYPVEAWKDVFTVNVHGVFHCCRAVVPLMRARNYGRIVNIASVAGKEGNPNASAYSASKAVRPLGRPGDLLSRPAHDPEKACPGLDPGLTDFSDTIMREKTKFGVAFTLVSCHPAILLMALFLACGVGQRDAFILVPGFRLSRQRLAGRRHV